MLFFKALFICWKRAVPPQLPWAIIAGLAWCHAVDGDNLALCILSKCKLCSNWFAAAPIKFKSSALLPPPPPAAVLALGCMSWHDAGPGRTFPSITLTRVKCGWRQWCGSRLHNGSESSPPHCMRDGTDQVVWPEEDPCPENTGEVSHGTVQWLVPAVPWYSLISDHRLHTSCMIHPRWIFARMTQEILLYYWPLLWWTEGTVCTTFLLFNSLLPLLKVTHYRPELYIHSSLNPERPD